jgi:hypothetical protein
MIQLTCGKSEFVYKISEKDPTVIMVRRNAHNARYKICGTFNTAEQAKAALFALEILVAGMVRE